MISPRFSTSGPTTTTSAPSARAGEDENEDEDVDADATFTTPVKGGDEWETVDVSSAEKKED